MSRTVLLITTDYPPLAGTNTRRVEAFARYLPAYGWHPVVLTMALEDMPLIESSWQGDDSVETVRVKSPGVQALARRLRGQRPRSTGELTAPASADPALRATDRRGLWPRLLGAVWASVVHAERACYVPDPGRPWAVAALRSARRIAAARQVDAVVTSSPPFSAHLVGLVLRRRLGVPWVADFRDLWVGRPFRALPYAWQHRLDRRYEARVVANADRLLLASPGWLPIFERGYGSAFTGKATVITNGFDRAQMEVPDDSGSISTVSEGPLTIVYTGALHAGVSPRPLIDAVLRLAQHVGHKRVRAGLSVRLIGPGASGWAGLMELLRGAGLDGVFEFPGTLAHEECLREQRRADALLILLAPPHIETICGKSFEYMATGKPILALVPDGSVQSDILAPSGLATVVSYDDVAATAQVLERWLTRGVPQVAPDWAYINRFERQRLTETLTEVLDDCVGAARSLSEVRA